MKRLFFLSALCALLAGNAWSQQLRLPATFGSQMVMQREMPFAVKGKAAAGAAVEVTLSPPLQVMRILRVKNSPALCV